jgi:hypothetical protein
LVWFFNEPSPFRELIESQANPAEFILNFFDWLFREKGINADDIEYWRSSLIHRSREEMHNEIVQFIQKTISKYQLANFAQKYS